MRRTLLALGFAVLALPASANAQTTASTTFGVVVPVYARIEVDRASMSFPAVTAGDLGSHIVTADSLRVTANGNTNYMITYVATTDKFVDENGTPTTKNVGDFELCVVAGCGWFAQGPTDGEQILSASDGTAPWDFNFAGRVFINPNEPVGTYKITIVFTVTPM